MSRYFFDLTGDIRDPDSQGIELSGLDQARHEATLFAIDTLKDSRNSLWEGGEFRVEVSDSARKIIFVIAVSTKIEVTS